MADPEADPSVEWLNLTQAANRLGWPRERLRSLARRGRLQTKRGNSAELFVLLTPELLAMAMAGPKADPGPPQALTEAPEEADHLRDRVAELEAQVADLRVALARAEERERTANAIAQAKEAASRELLAELRRDLEWHRRPWWQRWFPRG